MAKTESTTKPATTRRKARTIEEQIAELKAKAEAQAARKLGVIDTQLAQAEEQLASAKDRVEKIEARVSELKAQRDTLAPAPVKDEPKDSDGGTDSGDASTEG